MSSASFSSACLPMHTASEKDMRLYGQRRAKVSQVDGRTLAERVAAFLRGQHPTKTAQCVEAETEISANTVRKWLEQGNAPSGPAYDALVRRYGAPFLCAVHPEARGSWFDGVARQEHQAQLEQQAAIIRQQLSDLGRGR